MGDLVTKAEFARRAGVAAPTISEMCEKGKRLHKAMKGKKIDANHRDAKQYLQHRELKVVTDKLSDELIGTASRPRQGRRARENTPGDPSFKPTLPQLSTVDVERIQHWPLIDIVRNFGSDIGLKDYVQSVKTMRDIARKEIDIGERRGDLVSREKVDKVFSIYDEANSRMLDDMPTKVAAIIHGIIDRRPSKEKLEAILRRELSKEAKGTKAKVKRSIRALRPKKSTSPDVVDAEEPRDELL